LIGDGKSTVRDLVAQKNMMRRSNPNLESKLLELDDSRLAALARSGIEEQAVLPEGELLIIDWKAGLSSGADSIQLLDYVHPTYLDLALKACDAVTGLTVCGVDIMATDFSLPAEPGNHAVVELNSAPGLGGHYFPVYGPVKDVARNIVELHVRMLRNEKDISAGEFFAQSLKDEFDNEENVLLQSLETAFEKRDIEDEVSENPTRLVEISLFGNLYHSGILDHIQKYCNDKSINGWVRNRIDYVSPGSVRLRVMGPVESIEGLIRDLREGEFSQKITNIVVVKAKRATRRGFRILNDQRIAVKDAGFEITPGNIGASAPTNSEATRRILIKGEWQVSRARTWCTGLALSLGLTIKCKSKGEDTLICRLQGAEEKIDEFLRHAVVGPEDMRIEMIRVLPLPQDAAQSSAPPQLRKTSQTGPRVLQFAKRMVRRVTAR
jgi:acylphosphatase